jgi:outer membrane receptor protein involved in Fe transport
MKNVFKFFVLSALLMSFALFAGSVFAQTQTTGSIEGVVTDATGAAVPGITVVVTRQGGIPISSTSNEEGLFRIANLEPGSYTIMIEAAKGFAKFEQANVPVNLSRTSSINVQLRPQGATETVTVTAGAGAGIDVTQNTTGTNVSTEQFSNFPTQRTVQSLYSIAPTVSRSGLRDASGRDRDPSVAGSSGPENNYILDGVTVTDPAFGGSGANLPFEFVQEVEIKTGAYGAEYGKSTGGIFNVVTKSGSNDVRGDAFVFYNPQSFVRETKQFAYTGSAPNGFSEVDAGFDIGGPIVRDKLWFFGAFNPQRRKNFFFTQTFRDEVENQLTTPFYAGKITWALSQNHVFNFSTFGDFTKQEGFLFGGSGFGADPNSFRGEIQTGGHNYAFRLNSTFSPNFIGEFSGGLHFQRANTIPESSVADIPLVTDNFAILTGAGTVAAATVTNIEDIRCIDTDDDPVTPCENLNFGEVSFVNAPGGSLQRNFIRQGFGLFSEQDRNRVEFAARMQNIWGRHTFKYGFEFGRNIYNIDTQSTGPDVTFGNPQGLLSGTDGNDDNAVSGFRTTNNLSVCTTRGNQIVCPNATAALRAGLIAGTAGFAGGAVFGPITADEALNNPFLVLLATRVRDFKNIADTYTNTEGFYFQDDIRATRNLQVNLGLRWDFQQAYGQGGSTYLTLNDWVSNTQPRIGFSWDFTGEGRGKLFANFARFLETPIPLDINVRAGSEDSQTDKNFNVSRYASAGGSIVVPGLFGSTGSDAIFATANLGAHPTPLDPGLKPQTVNEWAAGFEYEPVRDLTFGFRGVYRAQDEVIEDGSFDDGNNYFIFNPGRRGTGNFTTTEDLACNNPDIGCFGPARRYYRALEFSATKRFSNNYQFIASYVFSSLIGNYEGLFRNDNGQSDPNITSLFDLVSLLPNTYGRLPNDRPHQFKFDGSYRWPFGLMTSASFRIQSGIPFSALIPHPVYGNNEGFEVPRGTAIVPLVPVQDPSFPNIVESVGDNRTPRTYNLDLGAYYPIQFGENRQLRFQADWFNVTNQQRAITLDQTLRINSGIAGVAPIENPFFGAGQIFQFPSSLRLGVKFQF